MELYVLDSLIRRVQVVDSYISLIWADRMQKYGDFELVIRSTLESRSIFKTSTWLACNESHHVMEVETIEDSTDAEGRNILTVRGRSIESILANRVAMSTLAGGKWTITGTPAAVARKIFHDICVTGVLNAGDVIPFVVEGTFLPTDTIPEPLDPITVDLDPQDVGSAIMDICNVWTLGFRLLRNFDTSQLYFSIYAGSDRTTNQTVLPPVVFSPNLDNLQNTTEFTTVADAKNVAYVYSPAGYRVVYPEGIDPEIEGFERRVMIVQADDITAENPDVQAALLQRGLEALSQNRAYSAFDGEINQNSQYKHGVDYFVGDLVEMQGLDGSANQMRVIEQIFVSDAEGDRSYPTLAVNTFINTGSWLAWTSNKVWMDYDADMATTWSTLP